MKKAIICLTAIMIAATVFAESSGIIIPQKDDLYSKLEILVSDGLIKSVQPGFFRQNAITKYEAAAFLAEASSSFSTLQEHKKDDGLILEKYGKLYPQTGVSVVPASAPSADITGDMEKDLSWLESQFAGTRFTDSTPFKLSGIIGARYMNVESSGISNVDLSSFSSTNLQLTAAAVLTDKIRLDTNITLQVPQYDPAFGTNNVSLNGDKRPVWLDVYTLTFDIYGFKAVTGFFWEDITSFIASQGQSERIGIFERDKYAGEEGTKSHFETVFRNFWQNRDYRWSKHAWQGLDLYKDGILGKDIFKLAAGKPEESFGSNEYWEYAARYTHFQNLPFAKQGEISLNAYNRSNDYKELLPFVGVNEPSSLASSITILGGDLKATLFNLFKLKAEFERSSYKGGLPVSVGGIVSGFLQEGNAMLAHVSPVFLPKGIDLVLKYTRIDPGYVAPASAVADNSYRVNDPGDATKTIISQITYADDPTALYNNMSKVEAHAYINVPNGILMINYGVSSTIEKTGSMFESGHWLIGTEWGEIFNSNYGWVDPAQHAGFMNYNLNRYGADTTGSSSFPKGAPDAIITGGKGGMTTLGDNREYMVSNAVAGNTDKYLSNLMLLLRIELNRFIKWNSPLMLELYGELIKLSDGPDYLAWYDPDKLLAQGMASACLVYNVMPRLSLIGFAGFERWGAKTVIPKPIDYLDTAYGLGVDYDLAGRAFLYLRLKNFYHDDVQVPANNLRGLSVWAELKSFF